MEDFTRKQNTFFVLLFCFSLPLVFLIVVPLTKMITAPSIRSLLDTVKDPEVVKAITLSIYTSLWAALISFAFGTPLAYVLARKNFKGKRLVEGIIDLPIMIPHPVIGIAILSLVSKDQWIGKILQAIGIQIMGTTTGIITVLTFVGMPFYINTVKAGFESIPVRLEKVSRSLGAGPYSTFVRVTFPLAWRSMVLGTIMCVARAISEFGAVVMVAYFPMTAPVLIYERFTAYGLKYSQPVAVWLIIVSLVLFVCMRLFAKRRYEF